MLKDPDELDKYMNGPMLSEYEIGQLLGNDINIDKISLSDEELLEKERR